MAAESVWEGLVRMVLEDQVSGPMTQLVSQTRTAFEALGSLGGVEIGAGALTKLESNAQATVVMLDALRTSLRELQATPQGGAGGALLQEQVVMTENLIRTLEGVQAANAQVAGSATEAAAATNAAVTKNITTIDELHAVLGGTRAAFGQSAEGAVAASAQINTAIGSSTTKAAILNAELNKLAQPRNAAGQFMARPVATEAQQIAAAQAQLPVPAPAMSFEERMARQQAAGGPGFPATTTITPDEGPDFSRVEQDRSAAIRKLQYDKAMAEAKLRQLTLVEGQVGTEAQILAAEINVQRNEERLAAATAREAKQASGGGGRGGGGVGGGGGGGSEGGGGLLGGIGLGSALKYWAFYQVFSYAERALEGLISTTSQYSLAVNQLSIALGVNFEAGEKVAEGYASIGSTMATKPAVAINAATEYGRFFNDKSGLSGTIGAELGSTINLLEAKTAKDGEEERLIKKRLSEVAAITLNYGMGAQQGADLYGSSTVIAQHYGVGAVGGGGGGGGALLGGGAQISDILKEGGFSAEEGLAVIAAVMQRTSDTSEAAASDLKRVLGKSATNPLNALFLQYGINPNLSFKEDMKQLAEKYEKMPEAERAVVNKTLGGNRVGNVSVALLENIGEIDRVAAEGKSKPHAATTQAEQELQTFAGYIKTIHGDLGVLAADLSQTGLGGIFKGLLAGVGPLIKGLDVLLKGLNLLPDPINITGTALAAMAVAARVVGGSWGVSGATAAAGKLTSGLGWLAPTGAAAAGSVATTGAARLAEAEAGAVATTATATLTTAMTAQAQAAGMTTLASEARVAASEEEVVATAAVVAAKEQYAAAIAAEGTFSEAATVALDALVVAEGELEVVSATLVATTEALDIAIAEEVTTKVAAVAASEALVVAEAEQTTTAAAATAATEALVVAEVEQTAASGGVIAGLVGMASAAGLAALAMAPLAEIIGGLILLGQMKGQLDKAEAGSKWIDAGVQGGAKAKKAGDIEGLRASIGALDNGKQKLDSATSGVAGGALMLGGNLWGQITGQGWLSATDEQKKMNAGIAKLRAEQVAYLNELLKAQKAAGKEGAAGSILFGPTYGSVDMGIRALGSNRLSAKDSATQVMDLLQHTDVGGDQLHKELLPEDGSLGIIDEVKRVITQSKKGRDPKRMEADFKTQLPIVDKLKSLAEQAHDPAIDSAVQGLEDMIYAPYYDMVVSNANSRIASIKAIQGNTKKSNAQIRAIMGQTLRTTSESGDIQSTLAAINVMDKAQFASVTKAVASERATAAATVTTLRNTMARAIAFAQASFNATHLIDTASQSLEDALATAFGTQSAPQYGVSAPPTTHPVTAAETAAAARLKAAKAQLAKLDTQQATLAAASDQANPTGSGLKFDKSEGPTAAQIEEARLASQAVPGDPASAALANLRAARVKMATPAKDQVEYFNNLKALHEAEYAYSQAVLAGSDAELAASAIPGDPINQAAVNIRLAQSKLDSAVGQAAYWSAVKGMKDAQYAYTQAVQAGSDAQLAASEIPGDPISSATVNIKLAQSKLNAAVGTTAYWTGVKGLRDAKYAYGVAQLAAANDLAEYRIDNTNPVAEANEKVRQAARQLIFDRGRGAGSDVINKDRLALKQSMASAEKASFDQTFSDHTTNYNLQRESLSAYMSYLNSQHNYLSHVRVKTRQQVDELNQVDQALKGLADQMQGQFNLGSIKIPTVYEARRNMGAGATSSTVHININGADLVAVKGIIAQYVGQGVMATAGSAVRHV